MGRVVSERTRLSADDKQVFTDYTIEILQVVKGDDHSFSVGDKIVVSKVGGNVLVEGRPVRVDTPKFPPIPWIQRHIFFLTRYSGSATPAPYVYVFSGGQLGVIPLEHGRAACETVEVSQHPATESLCGKTEDEILGILKEMIGAKSEPKQP